MSDKKNIKFLLGSNTKRGFVPLFDELRNPMEGKRLYILKGGPGTGKSSLMRKVAKVLEDKQHTIEYIHCASDPGSLDAFIDYDGGIAMVDGTAPHIVDPEYPGAYDVIINMADCWNDMTLIQHKSQIIHLSDSISSCHRMATSCISSAAALLDSNVYFSKPYVKYDTVNDFIGKLVKKLEGTKIGMEKKRLLSAVSVDETVFFDDTIKELCKSIYVIPDIWGAASDALLSELYRVASILEIERFICYCSIRTPDKIDHIIFPSAGIAVTTANSFHKVKDIKHIVIPDLMNPIPNNIEKQMTVHLDKAEELIDMACEHIKRAKLLHDNLEAFYVNAMDFSKVDLIFDNIIKELFQNI